MLNVAIPSCLSKVNIININHTSQTGSSVVVVGDVVEVAISVVDVTQDSSGALTAHRPLTWMALLNMKKW